MRRSAIALVLLAALAGCSEDFFDPTPGRDVAQPAVELIGENIRILPGEAAAVRIGFRPKDPSVRVRIERSSSAGRVVACPLRTIDDPLPPVESCLTDLPDGVRESLSSTGLGAVALVREGDSITIDIRLDYEEGGRAFQIRLPAVPVPPGASVCKDNACNPFFEVLPLRGGDFTATARWTGGTATLELLEGRVRAKAFSSTGIPYRVAATSSAASPLAVRARLNAPGEYALALVNTGATSLTGIRIDATWP